MTWISHFSMMLLCLCSSLSICSAQRKAEVYGESKHRFFFALESGIGTVERTAYEGYTYSSGVWTYFHIKTYDNYRKNELGIAMPLRFFSLSNNFMQGNLGYDFGASIAPLIRLSARHHPDKETWRTVVATGPEFRTYGVNSNVGRDEHNIGMWQFEIGFRRYKPTAIFPIIEFGFSSSIALSLSESRDKFNSGAIYLRYLFL
jgi:hypothetical protein